MCKRNANGRRKPLKNRFCIVHQLPLLFSHPPCSLRPSACAAVCEWQTNIASRCHLILRPSIAASCGCDDDGGCLMTSFTAGFVFASTLATLTHSHSHSHSHTYIFSSSHSHSHASKCVSISIINRVWAAASCATSRQLKINMGQTILHSNPRVLPISMYCKYVGIVNRLCKHYSILCAHIYAAINKTTKES